MILMQILGNIVMIFLGAIIIGTAFNGLINAYNKTHPHVENMYYTNSDKSKNTNWKEKLQEELWRLAA